MRCPSCDKQVNDLDAAFCPRCGAALGAPQGDATKEISGPAESRSPKPSDGDTEVVPVGDGTTGAGEIDQPDPPIVHDFLRALRGSLRQQGATDIVAAAAFAFLVLVACGAVLVAAAKLQYQFLGEGSGSFSVLSAIVMVGLGALRVPIHIGGLTVSALPLGVLALLGWVFVWATSRIVQRGTAPSLRGQILDGMKVAIPFALICWISALVFRIDEGPSPVAADAPSALLLGALWGAIFGALGGLKASKDLRKHLSDGMALLASRSTVAYEGLSAAGLMLAATIVLALFAALIWIIVGLLEGRPGGDFGLREAGAALIYLVGFGPNVVAAIVTVSLGAPVEVGAQVTSSGRAVGSLNEISLFEWGSGGPPWYAFALLAIPVVSCLLGGFSARRRTKDPGNIVQVLAIAAAFYAVVLFEFSGLSEARLGAGLIRNRGFGRIAPDAGTVAVLSFAWAIVAGFIGWRVEDASRGPSADSDVPPAVEGSSSTPFETQRHDGDPE